MTGVAPLTETPLLRDVLRHVGALLREAGVDTPELDARILMSAALGMTREHMLIHATARLNQAQVDRVLGRLGLGAGDEQALQVATRGAEVQ